MANFMYTGNSGIRIILSLARLARKPRGDVGTR